jgi:hypothetical protein
MNSVLAEGMKPGQFIDLPKGVDVRQSLTKTVKLGVGVRPDGTLTAIIADTGQEIEGQVSIAADSGIDRTTQVTLKYNAYAKDGKQSIG